MGTQSVPRDALRIVASMIVRDEQDVLGDCLASLRGFVDEVVVCDTGSTDATVTIAERAGARVVRAEWTDDFSGARNAALDHCRDADWVLWIDADERLECPNPTAARDSLEGRSADVLLIEVENVRRRGDTSISLGTRLFRPSELSFRGRVHEELRRADGSPLDPEPFPELRISHLGYLEEAVSGKDKVERNLRIAQAAFEDQATAKSALDLARSLGFAGRDPADMLAVVEQGLMSGEPSSAVSAGLLTIKANLELETGEAESACADALRALSIVPGDDVAAAVFARAATDLGRDEALVDEFGANLSSQGPTRIPGNRAEALALAAAAAVRLHRQEKAAELLRTARDVLEGDPTTWTRLVAALQGGDPRPTLDLIRRVAGPDARTAADAVAAAWGPQAGAVIADPDQVTALGSAPADDTAGALGISISFGGDSLPVPVEDLAAWVPPSRRVVEWTTEAEFADLLRGRGCRVASLPDVDTGSAIDELLEQGHTFDVAVGGVHPTEAASVLDRLRSIIDPAGVVALWTVGDDGVVADAVADRPSRGSVGGVRVEDHGFILDPVAPRGVVAGRPEWDTASFQADSRASADRTVVVWSEERLAPEMALAYRASIPGDIEVVISAGPRSPDTAGAAAVLVTAADVMPDARWVQACLDAFFERGRPAGPRLIDVEHRVIHAGLTGDGRPIAAGEPSSSPLLQVDRSDVVLAAPYVTASEDFVADERPIGDVIGSAVAISVERVADASGGVGTEEMFGRSVLLVGGQAPGTGHPDTEHALEALFDHVGETGITPVYQWEGGTSDPDPYTLQRWRRRGAVLFPPSPLRRDSRFGPDADRPRADALAVAFSPEAVVYLSPASLQWDFQTISRVSTVTSVYAGGPAGDLADRADESAPLDDVADVLDRLLKQDPPITTPSIPDIAATDRAAGLVSIVIPVFNNWPFTERCLSSIKRYTSIDHEVIVVDNGSTDATAAALERAGVVVITNEENRGFPAAVNQGIARSRGEFVCVLNNDTEVTPRWMEEMLAALSVPGTGLVGPRSNRISGLQQVPDAPALRDSEQARQWARRWQKSRRGRSWPIPRLVGFCLLARRATFEELGGFDEGFGIGNFEDDELGRRVMEAGLTLRVADGSVVLHHGGATFDLLGADYVALLHGSKRRLREGPPRAAAGVVAVILSDGNPIGAAVGAATAAPITDRVVIAERGALASTQIAAAAVRAGHVDVVPVDWASDDGAEAVLSAIGESMALVIGSSERIENTDWGAARAELESLGCQAAEVATPTGSEVRLVPADFGSAGMIGSHVGTQVEAFRLVPQSAGPA